MAYASQIHTIEVAPGATVVGDASAMFQGIDHAVDLDLRQLDVSQVTTLAGAFQDVHAARLDVTGWDTRQVKDLSHLFERASFYRNIKGLATWQTGQVTTMANFMRGIEFDAPVMAELGDWQTANVTDMHGSFAETENISVLDLSHWDMRQVKDCREFATWTRPNKRRIQIFRFGPHIRFDGAQKQTVLPLSRGYSHKWHQMFLRDTQGDYDDCEATYTPADLQKRYTGQAPQELQTYILDFFSLRVAGHDQKIEDGRPAEIDLKKYQLDMVYDRAFATGFHFERPVTEDDLEFGGAFKNTGRAPSEPGTYPVVLSQTGLEELLDLVDPFEDDTETYTVNVHPRFFGTYTILPKDPTQNMGKVQVRYATLTGEELAQTTLTGKIGSAYVSSQRDFKGYQLREVQGDILGTFTQAPQTITYLYAADEADENQQTPGPEQPGTPAPQPPVTSPEVPSPGETPGGDGEPTSPDGNGTPGHGDVDGDGDHSGQEPSQPGGNQGETPAPAPNPGQPEPGQPGTPAPAPSLPVPTPTPQPGPQPNPQPQPETKPKPDVTPQPEMQSQAEPKPKPKPKPNAQPTATPNRPVPGTPQLPGTSTTTHPGNWAPATTVAVPAGQATPTADATVTLTGGLTGATRVPTQPASQTSTQHALPQTNDQTSPWWHLLGAFLLAGTLYCGRRWKNLSKK
ncbi:BspA family leucine-rich repeat surface protein [Levilactobacillus zymae]|uniref:BspA family leucine-rich repeat surface protein n=1 Tax=Levilactobacillus zymae TaxID=267363 RepID=UPI0028B2C4C4|nr:BspA family leucine-rich repeat surface protein [Levilactobacillus zymae]MDT6979901.1 BspA family leucine-rich repeat surface protein [Levilactobacillus zymae]